MLKMGLELDARSARTQIAIVINLYIKTYMILE